MYDSNFVIEEEKKRLDKIEQEKKATKDDEKEHKKVVKRKKKGMASWESGDDEYDATEDLGGEFDLNGAMKSKKRASGVAKLEQKGRQLKADLLGIEENKGKAYFEQKELNKQATKRKTSKWSSIIRRWGGKKTQKGAVIGGGLRTPTKKDSSSPVNALRKGELSIVCVIFFNFIF